MNELSLTLSPIKQKCTREEAKLGAINFVASVFNDTKNLVLFGHPESCRIGGDSSSENKVVLDEDSSQMLLIVKAPSNRVTILEQRMFFGFETRCSSTISYILEIPPQQSREFLLGWFFLHQRVPHWMIASEPGKSLEASSLFLKEVGEYKVKLSYRNFIPQAIDICNERPVVSVWRGELVSDEITVEIN